MRRGRPFLHFLGMSTYHGSSGALSPLQRCIQRWKFPPESTLLYQGRNIPPSRQCGVRVGRRWWPSPSSLGVIRQYGMACMKKCPFTSMDYGVGLRIGGRQGRGRTRSASYSSFYWSSLSFKGILVNNDRSVIGGCGGSSRLYQLLG